MRCLYLALAAVLLWPASALAQATGNLTIKIDGKQVDNTSNVVYLNKAHCEDDVEIEFTLKPMGNVMGLDNTNLQAWRGPAGTDCNATSARMDDQGCSSADCTRVGGTGEPIQNTGNIVFSSTAQTLFGAEEGDNATCLNGKERLTFVAVGSVDSNCSTAVESQLPEEAYVEFTLLTAGTNAPTKVRATEGDSAIRVNWSGDGKATDTYVVLAEGGLSEGCDNTMLIEGDEMWTEDMVSESDAIVSVSSGDTSSSVNTDDLGLDYNQYAAVAVITVDEAGNRSPLSNVDCTRRIETSGLVDTINSNRDEDIKTCSSLGLPGRGLLLPTLSAGLLGLLLWRRKRSAS